MSDELVCCVCGYGAHSYTHDVTCYSGPAARDATIAELRAALASLATVIRDVADDCPPEVGGDEASRAALNREKKP